jgi:hypothetical protein
VNSIRHALRAGFKRDAIYLLTKIDRWFLQHIKEIGEMEEKLAISGWKGLESTESATAGIARQEQLWLTTHSRESVASGWNE